MGLLARDVEGRDYDEEVVTPLSPFPMVGISASARSFQVREEIV